jgi:hypothetical protein
VSELDTSGARLAVTWRATGTHQVLAAYDDHRCWWWALATTGAGSETVGSFGGAVPEELWPAVVALAARVEALAATAPPREPRALGLEVSSGTSTAWLPLASPEAAHVAAEVQPLLELTRRHPIAAARLITVVTTAPTGQRLAGYSLTSVGTEPVVLTLDPEALVLIVDGSAELLPPPRMGLVAGDGTLLDGLYQPARIEPGANGACTVLLDPTAGPGDGAVTGRVRGTLTLVGPWDVSPTLPFEATGGGP